MAEKVWQYSFTSRLMGEKPSDPLRNGLNDPAPEGELSTEMEGIEGPEEKLLSDNPLLMTESGWNPARAREKAIEMAMEKWGTPAFYTGRTGVLAAYVYYVFIVAIYHMFDIDIGLLPARLLLSSSMWALRTSPLPQYMMEWY